MSVQIEEIIRIDGMLFDVEISWEEKDTFAHVKYIRGNQIIVGEDWAHLHPDDTYSAVIGAREAMRKACAQDPVFKPLFRHFRNRFALSEKSKLYLDFLPNRNYELYEDIIGDKRE